jgi:hypothetical protein
MHLLRAFMVSIWKTCWAVVALVAAMAFAAKTPLAAQTQLATPTPLATQTEMPTGFVRGAMATWEGTPALGQITVRAADGSLSFCGYDFRSWFERAHERIAVAKLVPGDLLEVLADRKPGTFACYVRIVHVLDPPARVNPRRIAAVKPPDPPMLRGDRTVSGVVLRREGPALTVRTRTDERTLLLRADTAYFGDGLRLDSAALVVNTHIFVRAGRNSDGRIEAYQVMWGRIVDNPGN